MSVRKRHERNIEALEAVVSLCDTARKRQVDAVIIPGNLWDGQTITISTVSKLVDAFAGLGDIPVIIAPGPSDPLTPQSFYHTKVLSAHAIRPWSRNVHVFPGSEYSQFEAAGRAGVVFVGRACCLENIGDIPKQKLPTDVPADALKIVVDPEFAQSESQQSAHYDYGAFSGNLNFTYIASTDGKTRGAGCGTLIARSLAEFGRRNALIVQMFSSDAGDYDVILESIISDRRRIVPVSVNVNGVRPQNLAEHVRKCVESGGADRNDDIVHLKLTGMYPAGVKVDFGVNQLLKDYFHVIVDDATRPDYMLDKIDPRTTEGKFIHLLQDMKKKAELKNGANSTVYGAELTPKTIEDALYYGLDALNQKKVTVSDVD